MSDVEQRLRDLLDELERAKVVPRGLVPAGALEGVKIGAVALDSLAKLTLLQEVEARFDMVVPEGDLSSLETFGDLMSLVVRLGAS